jgi:hypothetical protein
MNNLQKLREYGVKPKQIAKYLNELGILPPQARAYTTHIVNYFIHNREYTQDFDENCGKVLKLHLQKLNEIMSELTVI